MNSQPQCLVSFLIVPPPSSLFQNFLCTTSPLREPQGVGVGSWRRGLPSSFIRGLPQVPFLHFGVWPQGAQTPLISSNNQISGHWGVIRAVARPVWLQQHSTFWTRSLPRSSLLPSLQTSASFLSFPYATPLSGSQHTAKQFKGCVFSSRCSLRTLCGKWLGEEAFIQDHFFLIIKQMSIHLENRE